MNSRTRKKSKLRRLVRLNAESAPLATSPLLGLYSVGLTILYYSLIRLIMETIYGFSQNASKADYFAVFILPALTNKGRSSKGRTKHLQLGC